MPVADKLASGGRIGAFALVCAAPILFASAVLHAQEIIDLPAEDRWLEPRFEEVYRIGSLSGEDWEQFGRVRKVAFDGAGQLYVLDMQALTTFMVVDGSGRLRRTLGGPGEGPGEFRQALSFTVMPDGRVVVGDLGYYGHSRSSTRTETTSAAYGWDSSDAGGTLWEFMPDPAGDALFSAVGSQMLVLQVRREQLALVHRPGQSSALTLLATWSPGTPSPTAGCLRA